MNLVIGGIILCGECEAVFASLRDYEEHMEVVHMGEPDPDDFRGSDACYAEGIRRER